MEGESGVTQSIIDEVRSGELQGYHMDGESGVTRSIIDELPPWDIQGDQLQSESMVFHEVSLMKFILGISKEMKWKTKACCYSKYHRCT